MNETNQCWVCNAEPSATNMQMCVEHKDLDKRGYICHCGSEKEQFSPECDSCWEHNESAQLEEELARQAGCR